MKEGPHLVASAAFPVMLPTNDGYITCVEILCSLAIWFLRDGFRVQRHSPSLNDERVKTLPDVLKAETYPP
ncbi:hypothetical protein CEP51_016896 [Fusarium floridanum]|uniref:Uncharacterized protein n=1 Tax=Fusarium floridanum TaxID=1325733 RepID=A0A428NCW7_9HYPO|nr:hypothetical protein CEP51_016896 [Fusarium floridanum]